MSKLADEKMKPCPFCGIVPNSETWHGGKPSKHMVSCCNDECPCAPQCTGQSRAEAIQRWNIRAAEGKEPVAGHATLDANPVTAGEEIAQPAVMPSLPPGTLPSWILPPDNEINDRHLREWYQQAYYYAISLEGRLAEAEKDGRTVQIKMPERD